MRIKDKGIKHNFNKALENDQKVDREEMAKILSSVGDGQVIEEFGGRLASGVQATDHFDMGARQSGQLDLAGIRGGLSKTEGKDLDRMQGSDKLTSGARMMLSDFLTGRASTELSLNETPQGPTEVSSAKAVDFKGETTIAGEWRLTQEALEGSYRGVSAENFMTTTIQVPEMGPDGNPIGVKEIHRRDNQYFLDDNKEQVGYKLIPVSDGPMTLEGGERVSGSHHLDKMIGEDEYVFLMYTHPEEHNGDLETVAKRMVKPENGITHLAGYMGEGETVNSPRDYHDHEFQVKGYPATAVSISNGEEHLGKSIESAARVLNPTVKFPPDYKNDKLMAHNMANTFKFYKATLEGDTSITQDPDWAQYCAEHQLVLSSVGLNLPQNLEGYQEVYGEEDGARLWDIAKSKGVTEAPADFEPHYKKLGMEPPRGNFDGGWQETGKAMAWVPETTADLVQDFVTTYVPFKEVGGQVAAGALGGFKDTVMDRMGLSSEQVDAFMQPAQGLLIQADAKVAGGMSVEDADAWLQEQMIPLMEQARAVPVSDDSKTQRYSAPATLMRHVTGTRGQGNGLTYKVLGTIVDSSEVEPND